MDCNFEMMWGNVWQEMHDNEFFSLSFASLVKTKNNLVDNPLASLCPLSFIHIYDVNMYNYYKVVCYFYKCWFSWIKIQEYFHWDASKGSFDLFISWVCSKDYDVIETLNDHSTSITTVKFACNLFQLLNYDVNK